MDTLSTTVLLFLSAAWTIVNGNTMWEHLSLKYGLWYRPPRTPVEALQAGYIKMNHICKMDTYHGFLYMQENNDISRLIFDLNNNLAGIQTLIPGNMEGYNARNETIRLPPPELMPPILLSQERNNKGTQMYMITAYFKHPSLICSPYSYHVHSAKGLYIQMGYNIESEYERIPLESRHLAEDWKQGNCMPKMGLHYFKNLSPTMQCEMLYPLFLMYNTEGQLGGFGWVFQGEPMKIYDEDLRWFRLTPPVYPFTFDTNMLPQCMFNPKFKIFGIHIWLRNEDKMICPLPTVAPQTKRPPPSTYRPQPIIPTDNNIIVDKIIRDRQDRNRGNDVRSHSLVLSLVLCVLCALFVTNYSTSSDHRS